ncbi:alpha/beta fold hydrolase [Pararobbsia alpina]|uniref:AB hydrolase superfamily protein YdjP n=1 Tax=Pararobbsia alpina TaxID=621374 RepID=A0A6S7B728_9BURK|nr:alpha/beta fold hydrolase [Pararobbsia alpina]CAB3787847.1 AB hydrolase superfamily protein YdjP [Pararobbsia alpina]
MSQRINIGDMRVELHGQGKPVVFCHGFTTTSAFWREQVDVFADAYQVIALNLPGHGTSSRPTDRAYTVDAFVDDLAMLFDELNLEPAVLVGLSMGGVISQRFALAHARRLRGLVLVDTTASGLGEAVKADNVLAAIERLGIAQASCDVAVRSFGADASDSLVDFARHEVIQTPEFVARQAIISLNNTNLRDRLADIGMPTLVLCGEDDRITPPEESRALASGIPGSKLVMIPHAAHFPMLEQPARFNAELQRFIESIDA